MFKKHFGNSTSAFHVLGLYEFSDLSNQALIDASERTCLCWRLILLRHTKITGGGGLNGF